MKKTVAATSRSRGQTVSVARENVKSVLSVCICKNTRLDISKYTGLGGRPVYVGTAELTEIRKEFSMRQSSHVAKKRTNRTYFQKLDWQTKYATGLRFGLLGGKVE